MTKTYAARRLLALGPLTFREFYEITGWRYKQAQSVIERLLEREEIRRISERGTNHYLYGLV